MNLIFIGFTLDVIGKIMVAFTAIMVHHRMLNEHKIDKIVFRSMKQEQMIGLLGIIFIVVGYIMQIPSKL